MEYFGLSLEEEKSRLIEFGRYAKARCQKLGKKPETFTFLGFTHYCSQSRNGRFRGKRKTSKKKFAKKCREINLLLARMRKCSLKEIVTKLNQILTGYYHYYGITDNSKSITAFRYNIMKSLFYCLNRRSQKKSYNWIRFLNMMNNSYPLVRLWIMSVYMNDNVNNSFRKEPDAEKPHVRICEGRTIVRGASTRPLAIFLKKKDQK